MKHQQHYLPQTPAAGNLLSDHNVLCIAEALQLALERISSLITGLCEAGKSLQNPELHALELLVEGLHLYDECHQAEKLCR